MVCRGDLDGHAAGEGAGTVTETPKPVRSAKTEATWVWYLLQRGPNGLLMNNNHNLDL
jgi:hypothetical protein